MQRAFHLLLFVVMLPLLPLEATAQNATLLGVRGGLNVTDVSSEANTESRSGFSLAVLATFSSEALPFNIQTELNYTEKGFHQADPEAPSFRATFIEPHLLIRLPLDLSHSLRFNALAGVAPAFLLEQTAVVPGQEPEQGEVFGSVDLGASVGGNLTMDIAPGAVLLDVRYVHGLSDNISPARVPFNNRALTFSVGVAYAF